MSIKALANKVLQRNSEGNRTETQSFPDRKSEKPQFPCMETEPLPLPYLSHTGALVIPFYSDPRFCWWARGQSVTQTEKEVKSWKH